MDIAELAMMLESIDSGGATEEDFQASASKISSYSWLPDDQKLQFYGLYKQCTIGDINTKQPWAINMVAKAKWDAWKNFEGFPKESAMKAYIFLQQQLEEADPTKKTPEQFISDSTKSQQMATVQSSFAQPISNAEVEEWTDGDEAKLFSAVVTGEVNQLRTILDGGVNPSLRDSEGMTPLHYAADRGNAEILDILITYGADANSQDNEGQTPLMLAVMCENEDIVRSLLQKEVGADVTIRNNDGESAIDMIECNGGENEAIHLMLHEMISPGTNRGNDDV